MRALYDDRAVDRELTTIRLVKNTGQSDVKGSSEMVLFLFFVKKHRVKVVVVIFGVLVYGT